MTATRQRPLALAGKLGFHVLDLAPVARARQPRRDAPARATCSAREPSAPGCILELTPEGAGGWLKPGDLVELTIERLGTLRNRVVPHP